MEPVRFGLVGYGFGGRWFHAPLLGAAPECAFLGVVTTSEERRALVAREHPDAALFGSLEELVAAGAEAVAISTPAVTHSALTDAALDLGLAVVCDKPFALDAAAARASVERAERLGLALAPYQNRRWDSDFRTVRALVERGTLGTVTRFESRFERFDPEPGPPAAGGGTLLDFGAHLVDQALVLLGPVESVYAEFRVRESGLDDDVFVALTHAQRRALPPLGQLEPGRPRLAVPRDRDRGRLRGGRADGRPGGGPARRPDARDRRRAVGRGAPGTLGRGSPAAARASRCPPSAAGGTPSTRRSPGRCAVRAPSRSTRATPSPRQRCSTPPAAARRTASSSGSKAGSGTFSSRPFASRITSTTCSMISVSPKSFGVKTRATPCSRSRRASLSGMIPPTTTGTSSSPASFRPSSTAGHDLQVRAGQHRQPDDVHVLLDRGGDDLRRGEPDALVDRPRSRRRGRGRRSARRRWSARRGRACRPGSAAGRPAPRRWPAPAPARRSAIASASPPPLAAATPGGRPVLAEHLAQHPGPLPRRHAGAGALEGGRHEVRRRCRPPARSRVERLARAGSGSRSARHFCTDLAAPRPPPRGRPS